MRRDIRTPLTRRQAVGLTAGTMLAAAVGLPGIALAQAGAAPTGAAPTGAAGTTVQPWLGEKVYGDPNAPVTVIEYASLACSHCADFHTRIWPVMKKEFVDNGQVKLIFRDYPLNGPGLRAHMLARCGGEVRFIGLKDVLFKTQANWLNQNFDAQLRRVAGMAGVSPAQFDACMADKALENFLVQSQMTGGSKFNINSTPTFIVENTGAVIAGAKQDELFAALEAAGAKRAGS
ncbi:MAG: hypothetical protein RLY86_2381 [Pseudomonadota bacterium]|jgi:protein-disulfide isomerase